MQAAFEGLVSDAEDLLTRLETAAIALAALESTSGSIVDILADKQDQSQTLDAISALSSDPGVLEQIQAGIFSIRPIDAADALSLMTRALADTRYLGGAHTAASATKLATARTIGMTGDVVWTSPAFDGTANVTAAGTIQGHSVTFSKMVAATQKALIGATSAGNFGEITLGTGISLVAGVLSATGSGGSVLSFAFTNGGGFTGVVTNPSTTPALALTLDANGVALSKLAAAGAASILGATAAGNAAYLTPAQAKTVLAIAATDVSGLASVATLGTFASLTSKPTTLAGYAISDAQGLSALLTAYAGAAWSAGVQIPSLTAANTVVLKTVGSAAGNILDKASGDALYLAIGGTATAATKLATGRTIAMTGDVSWTSPTFDGTGNVTAAGTIAANAVTFAKFVAATQKALVGATAAGNFGEVTLGSGLTLVAGVLDRVTQTTVSGNAGTATALATGRTIATTGDVTWTSPTFDGTSNVTAAATVTRINGVALSGLATGILKNTTTTGAPSIAVAADFPTLNQSTTGSAATLTTSRNIDGQAFNGSANITVIAPGTHAATSKTTPVDADEIPLVDSAAANVLAKLTWANLKATLKTYLDTLYQPIAAALTSWAAVVRATGFDTFVATPTSANLRALLTDETGTGASVFAASPTFTGTITAANANYSGGFTFAGSSIVRSGTGVQGELFIASGWAVLQGYDKTAAALAPIALSCSSIVIAGPAVTTAAAAQAAYLPVTINGTAYKILLAT